MDTSHRTRLDTMVGELGRTVAGLAEAQQKMVRLTGEAWSEDRTVHAVVGPRGHLVDLHIDPRVYRRPDSVALAATIVATVQDAVAEVTERSQRLMETLIPPELRLSRFAGLDAGEVLTASDAHLLGGKDADVELH
jgi:DNA-binding protein YbaB